jgi:hypothetical protein
LPALNSLCAVPSGLLFRIFFVGDDCWQDPVDKMRHAYLDGGFYTENGAWEGIGSYMNADAYINGWRNLKIVVGEDRYVKFYIDDILFYSSTNKIDATVLEGKKIILDGRSSGSAGKVYHDYVKLSGQSPISSTTIEDLNKYNQIKQDVIGPHYTGPIQIQRIAVLQAGGVEAAVDTVQVDSEGKIARAWTDRKSVV